MTFLKSLPENAVLLNVLKAYPGPARELIEYHEVVLRGPSPLSSAERELIAAFVSALNGCRYCRGVHTATAEVLGVAAGTVDALMDDIDKAAVDDRLKPILHYAGKLTRQPDGLTQADAIFAAGWDDQALHDTVSVCAFQLHELAGRGPRYHRRQPLFRRCRRTHRRRRLRGHVGGARHLGSAASLHPSRVRMASSRTWQPAARSSGVAFSISL